MSTLHAMGWGLAGSAVTALTRAATRKAMHDRTGAPRLFRTVARTHTVGGGVGMLLMLAVVSGVALALSDVLQEQRARLT